MGDIIMKKLYPLIIIAFLAACSSNSKGGSNDESKYRTNEMVWNESITNFGIVSPTSNVTLSLSCLGQSSMETGVVKFDNGKIEYQHGEGEESIKSKYEWVNKSDLVIRLIDSDKYYRPDGTVDNSKAYQNDSKAYDLYIEEIYDMCVFFGPTFDQVGYDETLHCYRANEITLPIRNSNRLNNNGSAPMGSESANEEYQDYEISIYYAKYYFKNNKLTMFSFTMFGQESGNRSDYEVTLTNYGSTKVTMPTIVQHSYSQEYSYTENYHYHPCTDYGYLYLEGGAEPHSFVNNVVNPDFEHEGYTEHTCSICGYSYQDTPTEKLKHNFSTEWSHNDDYHYHYCIDEGYETLTDEKLAHEYTIIEDIPSTFTEHGYTKHSCICGAYYTDNEKDFKEHSYSDKWSYNDEMHYHACTDEGYEETLYIDEAVHTMGDWYEVTAPGETTEGVKERACSVCGYKEQGSIKPVGSVDRLIFELNEDNESYTVYGNKEKIGDAPIYIPDEYNGLPVTIIGQNAFANTSLTDVNIPESILEIKDYAFRKTLITNIVFPNSVVKVPSSVLFECFYLETIQLGSKMTTYFSSGMLYSLKAIYVDKDNPTYASDDGVLYTKDYSCMLTYPSGRSGKQYDVKEGTTVIAATAFAYAGEAISTKYNNPDIEYLQFVKLPEGIVTLEESAFNNSHIESIYMPNSVENISDSVFYYQTTIYMKYDIDMSSYPDGWNGDAKFIFIGECVAYDEGVYFPLLKPVFDWVMCDGCIYYLFEDGTGIFGHNPITSQSVTVHSQIIKDGVTYSIKEVGAYRNMVCGKITQHQAYSGIYFDSAYPVGSSFDEHTTLAPFSQCNIKKVYVEEGVEIFACYESFNYAYIPELHLPHSIRILGTNYFETYRIKEVYYNGTIAEWKEVKITGGEFYYYPEVHCSDGDYYGV